MDEGVGMNVRFIDTSIMTNLLDIPHRNEKKEEVWTEFEKAVNSGETLILPFSTIIETGNFIAHISDGNIRRNRASKFSDYLIKTANDEAPWVLYGNKFTEKDLQYIAEHLTFWATRSVGVGDLSIIRNYENYKQSTPGIGRIMIWSLDAHLCSYCEDIALNKY